MLNVLLDGMSVLYINIKPILLFVIAIFGLGFASIRHTEKWGLEANQRTLSGLAFGCVLLCLALYMLALTSYFWPSVFQPGSYAVLIFAIFAILKELWLRKNTQSYYIRDNMAIVIILLLLLLRLAFLDNIILPSYSDSPIHYQIVSGVLFPDISEHSNLSFSNIFNNYYHFGFHSLAAWLSSVTEITPENSISLLGQLFLIIGPLSISFLINVLTKNNAGALIAGLLAATGWSMPAFAVNWGKFPALAAVTMLPGVAALILLLLDSRLSMTRIFCWGLILLTGITLIHTRIVVCLFFLFASFFIVYRLQIKGEFGTFQSIRFTLLFMLFMWPLSRTLIDFYNNMPVLITLLVLIPFAFQIYPSASTGVLIFLSGLSLAALIPNLLNVGGQTLLDRQFIAMILHIPLSLIGGLGTGGLVKKLKNNTLLRQVTIFVIVTCVIVNLNPQSFYPDQCCNYFGESDNFAFQWLKKNSSSKTLFIISALDDGDRLYGTDAGIWISPLTEIPTNKLLFNINWDKKNLFDEICPSDKSDAYIYMGGRATSFDNSQLASLSWVFPAFQTGDVVIYQISSCNADMEKGDDHEIY